MVDVASAVLAALNVAAKAAAGDLGKEAMLDSYDGLKALFWKKFGNQSDLAEAAEKLERKPDAKGRQLSVADELEALNAVAAPEVLAAVQALLDKRKSNRSGGQLIQRVQGSLNAVADRGRLASVTISGSAAEQEYQNQCAQPLMLPWMQPLIKASQARQLSSY